MQGLRQTRLITFSLPRPRGVKRPFTGPKRLWDGSEGRGGGWNSRPPGPLGSLGMDPRVDGRQKLISIQCFRCDSLALQEHYKISITICLILWVTRRQRGCGSQWFSVLGSLALEARLLPRFCTVPGRTACLPFCDALALSQLLCAAKKTEPPPGTKAEALSGPGVVMGVWVWSFRAPEQPFIIQHLPCGGWIPSEALPPYMTLELLSGATGAIGGKGHNWERADAHVASLTLPLPTLAGRVVGKGSSGTHREGPEASGRSRAGHFPPQTAGGSIAYVFIPKWQPFPSRDGRATGHLRGAPRKRMWGRLRRKLVTFLCSWLKTELGSLWL